MSVRINLGKVLTGENLERYRNIQETIQKTQEMVTAGISSHKNNVDYEDIVPVLQIDSSHELAVRTPSSTEGISLHSLGSSASGDTKEFSALESQKLDGPHSPNHRFYQEKSDWMLDEFKCICKYTYLKEESKARDSSTKENTRETRQMMKREINMRLYDELTPDEERQIYEEVRNHYGYESGNRFLLIRSLVNPEPKIEPWATPIRRKVTKKQLGKIHEQKLVDCKPIANMSHNYICSDISKSVQTKMKTLVNVLPTCETTRVCEDKNWKKILRGSGKRKKKEVKVAMTVSPSVVFSSATDSDYTPCKCGLLRCDCEIIKKKCDVPKVTKECELIKPSPDETNNYLITCRLNLQDKQLQDRRVTVLQHHAIKAANRVTRESTYLQSAHDQNLSQLTACLMRVKPPLGQEVSDIGLQYVEELANAVAEHQMINEHEWRAWRHVYHKMENDEHSEEEDSLNSDIDESESSEDQYTECDIKYKRESQPSRIPYFKETYKLANVLFDKITAKLEKTINKNHNKAMIIMRRPISYLFCQKLALLKSKSKVLNQTYKHITSRDVYWKALIPFAERKKTKLQRAMVKRQALERKQVQRRILEGLQLGKKYKKVKTSFLYTVRENYRGFSPGRQSILRTPGTEKFKKCNLEGKDVAGKKLTRKRIHKDYRLIRRLFDGQAKRHRASLWDSGLKARMEEFLGMYRTEPNPTETELEGEKEEEVEITDVSTANNKKRPKKEEQKFQTAPPKKSDRWSYCSRSSENAAEAFTSLIRNLRSKAKSHVDNNSHRTPDPKANKQNHSTLPSSRGQTTSLGQMSTGYSSDDFTTKQPPTCERDGDNIGHKLAHSSRFGNKSWAGRPYTSESFSTFKPSEVYSSEQTKTTYLKNEKQFTKTTKTTPTKTLPPNLSDRISTKSVPQQKYPWKSSKTVR